MNKWIETKKQKPDYKPVLIWKKGFIMGNAAVAFYDDKVDKWVLFHTQTRNDPIETPDYWMPLPKEPKEGGEG